MERIITELENNQKANLVSVSNLFLRNGFAYRSLDSGQSGIMDIYQSKMIQLLISRVKPEDERFYPITITFADFMNMMNITRAGTYYESIEKSINGLMSLKFRIDFPDGKTKFYHLIAGGCCIDRENHLIDICLDSELEPLLLYQQKEFTAYELGYICDLKNKYSMRMYQYLRSMAGIGHAQMKVETFAKAITDNTYRRPAELMSRIIIPALEEINALTDITVECREVKKKASNGKPRTIKYYFKIKKKKWVEKKPIIDAWDMDGIKIKDMREREQSKRKSKDTDTTDGLPF